MRTVFHLVPVFVPFSCSARQHTSRVRSAITWLASHELCVIFHWQFPNTLTSAKIYTGCNGGTTYIDVQCISNMSYVFQPLLNILVPFQYVLYYDDFCREAKRNLSLKFSSTGMKRKYFNEPKLNGTHPIEREETFH